jgi:hypothetical protein
VLDTFGLNDDLPLPPGFHPHYPPGHRDLGYGDWVPGDSLDDCIMAAKQRYGIRSAKNLMHFASEACLSGLNKLLKAAHIAGAIRYGLLEAESKRLHDHDVWACYLWWDAPHLPPAYQLPKIKHP